VLRITINDEAKKVTLKLEGRIIGLWTAELERIWHTLGPSLNLRKLFVDLRGVSYMDREGLRVLADIYRRTQAHFQTDSPLMEYFAQEARNSNFQNGNGKGTETATEKETNKGVSHERSLRFRIE
jgi:ABC-type transporter Mla MlaB component